MLKVLFGIFLILHGLVHLLYFGQAMRYFELFKLGWPDGSWSFGRILSTGGGHLAAGIACVIAAAVFAAAGIGLFAGQACWKPAMTAAAVFSTLIWLLFWDGKLAGLSNQGVFAILINAGLILAVQVFHWPE